MMLGRSLLILLILLLANSLVFGRQVRTVALSGMIHSEFENPLLMPFAPAINDSGQVAFLGLFGDPPLNGTINDGFSILSSESGLVIDSNGEQALIMKSGEAAPGLPEGQVIQQLVEYDINNPGRVAVGARTSGGTTGVWSDTSGRLEPVALPSDPAMLEPLAKMHRGRYQIGIIDTGQVVIHESLSHRNTWFSQPDGSGPRLIGPGFPVGLEDTSTGPEAYNENGEIVIFGRLSSDPDGYYVTTNGQFELLARVGDQAPGTQAGTTYQRFYNFLLNNDGEVAFKARLAGPGVQESGQEGIWLLANGQETLIARTGDQHESSGLILSDLQLISIGVGGDVLFGAVVSDHEGEKRSTWLSRDGQLELLAATGHAAPTDSDDATFGIWQSPVINSRGQVAFLSPLHGGSRAQELGTGIWATDPNGDLRLMLQTGDEIEVRPGDLRTIRRVNNFDTGHKHFNSRGELVVGVQFSDFSEAVLLLRSVASPSFADYDVNDDGVLDSGDIDSLNQKFRGDNLDDLFDLNRDGQLDTNDFVIFIEDVMMSQIGDANLDGAFDASDLVKVFESGEYEDSVPHNSGWDSGDWNGDHDFSSEDLVFAFQSSGYEMRPRPAAAVVPEPSAILLFITGVVAVMRRRWSEVLVTG